MSTVRYGQMNEHLSFGQNSGLTIWQAGLGKILGHFLGRILQGFYIKIGPF